MRLYFNRRLRRANLAGTRVISVAHVVLQRSKMQMRQQLIKNE